MKSVMDQAVGKKTTTNLEPTLVLVPSHIRNDHEVSYHHHSAIQSYMQVPLLPNMILHLSLQALLLLVLFCVCLTSASPLFSCRPVPLLLIHEVVESDPSVFCDSLEDPTTTPN